MKTSSMALNCLLDVFFLLTFTSSIGLVSLPFVQVRTCLDEVSTSRDIRYLRFAHYLEGRKSMVLLLTSYCRPVAINPSVSTHVECIREGFHERRTIYDPSTVSEYYIVWFQSAEVT